MGKIVALGVKMLAEGRFGKGPAAVYRWLEGKKTWTGLAFGVLWGAVAVAEDNGACGAWGLDCTGISTWLGAVAAFLVSVGLYDAALRTKPPVN